MPSISVRIPQLGEGLQEALLVEFLKKPGDQVKRDEPIYVMETDKATTDVESPYEGTLEAWTVEEGTVLQIGQEVAKMMVADGVPEMPGHRNSQGAATAAAQTAEVSTAATGAAVQSKPAQKIIIPPRTRRYLKEKGLLELASQMPISGTKLTPDDVDRYLKSQREQTAVELIATDKVAADQLEVGIPQDGFQEQPLSKTQQTLNYRMQRGVQACVPVTMMQEVDWTAIDEARKITRDRGGESGFVMLLWCIVQALQNHPKFRSSLVSGKTLRTFDHVHLGIAVALPDDGLVTAVVKNSDEMTREQFNIACANQVELARQGNDQIDATTTLTVSNIGASGVRWGIPAIVSPAVATIAVGEIHEKPIPQGNSFEFCKTAQLVLSFDHRIANGVGAANFLNEICRNIEGFQLNSGD